VNEYAPLIAALSQPSSCAIGPTKTPIRYWLVPYETIVVAPSAITIVQP
jgi:hypothetical protein